jgi:hypothetical protein
MVREGQHSGISDDTRARARRFAEDAGSPKPANPKPPKQRVVSKKELEESGLSLRDFLNRERGLTRRGMSKTEAEKQLGLGDKPSSESVAKAKAQLGINDSEQAPDETTMKKGGKVSSASKRADGIAIRGKTRA